MQLVIFVIAFVVWCYIVYTIGRFIGYKQAIRSMVNFLFSRMVEDDDDDEYYEEDIDEEDE